ncbi:hypothetical protein BDR05DRAFT_1003140 [Suillus weaverae]|nr:hypothetical protein BDR05DRAFT_1003140 [Suillus weaverae]
MNPGINSVNDIGHLLSFIFKSFKVHLPASDTLRHTDTSLLYDSTTKVWPLALPVHGQSIERTFPLFLNSLNKALAKSFSSGTGCTLPPLWYGLHTTKPVGDDVIQRKPDLCSSNEVELEWSNILVVAELTSSHYSPVEHAGKMLDTKAWLIFREQLWRRFMLCLSFCKEYRELRVHIYDHSGGIVTRPVDIHQETDKFRYIMVCIIYSTRDCIGFDSTMFINPTQSPSAALWDWNVKNLSRRKKKVSNDKNCSESHVQHEPHSMDPYIEYLTSPSSTSPPHADNESPLPSSSSSDNVIGKMKVNEHKYDLLKVLFSGQGLVGRGTMCYLARRDGEEYIIKDHWVKNSRNGEVDAQERMDIVMNEVDMLEAMKGVPGVPKLVEFWLIEVMPNQPDDTQLYRQKIHNSTMGMYRTHVHLVLKPKACRLQEFRSRKELVRTLHDIALILWCAYEEHCILHRDCSLNNVMIEDIEGGSRGVLIDWEFAMRIMKDNMYPTGGTGTIPFMLVHALTEMGQIQYTQRRVEHTFLDDLESLFYIFAWVCIMFKGPASAARRLDDTVRRPDGKVTPWLPHEWNGSPLDAHACAYKKFFFVQHPMGKARLREQFTSYFQDLIPLAEEWYELVKQGQTSTYFNDIIALLNKYLDTLANDERDPHFVLDRIDLHELMKGLNDKLKHITEEEEDAKGQTRASPDE